MLVTKKVMAQAYLQNEQGGTAGRRGGFKSDNQAFGLVNPLYLMSPVREGKLVPVQDQTLVAFLWKGWQEVFRGCS